MKALAFLLLVVSMNVVASVESVDVVYGEDGRSEAYERPMYYEKASAVAAQIERNHYGVETLLGFNIIGPTHQEDFGLCNGERFASQPVIANCSGALVAPDIIMTAGHCMQSYYDCKGFDWVFGYEMNKKTGNPTVIEKKNIYQCKQVIKQSLNNGVDYAFIRLDRKVTDRKPLKLAPKTHRAKAGDRLVMFGYPSGLPLKVSEGAKVLFTEDHLLITSLDSFHGNSGAPVLDEKTGDVVGILVSGRPDYVEDRRKGCMTVNNLPEAMGDEAVTSLHVVPRFF